MTSLTTRYKKAAPILAAAAIGALIGAVASISRDPAKVASRIQPLWIPFTLYAFFFSYWAIAARNSAPVQRSESRVSSLIHQILLNISILFLFARIPGLAGRWLPLEPIFPPLGIAIESASIVLAIWARQHLGRNWSAEITAKVDHQLIRTGPYRRLRHPIYTAMFGMHIGIALASGEWHALVAVLLLTIAYFRKIRMEEKNLQEVFGDRYDAYRQDSWALIPGLL